MPSDISTPRCRSCGAALKTTFADLGVTPLANALISPAKLGNVTAFYPLKAMVCGTCFLVQIDLNVSPEEIFSDYLYFSSFSDTWLRHAADFTDRICPRLGLGPQSFVVEVASNDGYLLKNFVSRAIPCLGVEPAKNVAQVARAAGVETECVFLGAASAERIVAARGRANLIIANNVLAHVPDLNDFIAGMKLLLAPSGVIVVEAPHFLQLLQNAQFDTIYHEHFSYFSLLAAEHAFARHGLQVFDIEELETHGGSLRYFIRRQSGEPVEASVGMLREREMTAGLASAATYQGFSAKILRIKLDLLEFLINAARGGKTVACYGAAAKGNTLLNYCGITSDLIQFAADRNPHKQGRFLPGSRIPVRAPKHVFEAEPDFLLILPWNIKDEIVEKMDGIRAWGGRFVCAIPELEITPGAGDDERARP